MTQEFTIQCPQCGTLYNDLQEVCPYCGEPQPTAGPEAPAAFPADFPDDDVIPPREEDVLFDEPEPALYDDEAGYADDPFAEDDIFAVAGPPVESAAQDDVLPPEYGDDYDEAYYDEAGGWVEPEPYLPDDDLAGYDELSAVAPDFEPDEPDVEFETAPKRLRFRRVALGCLGFLLCVGLLYGGITVMAVRSGLQERAQLAQDESQERYQKGQALLEQNSIELAIAEFERAVKLNPTFREARDALREAQRLAKLQPTPTSQTRSQAAADIFVQAETQFNAENWTDAALTLSHVRDLDPDFQPDRVAEMIFEANSNLGQSLLNPQNVESALAAFEQALTEQPGAPDVLAQVDKITLYLQGIQGEDSGAAIQSLRKLYKTDAAFLDVPDQLQQAYRRFGDELGEQGDWCAAQTQYTEANALHPDRALQAKIETSGNRCQGGLTAGQAKISTATPVPVARATAPAGTRAASTPAVAVSGTAAVTGTTTPAAATSGNGRILFSAFNPFETRWEILAVPAGGGAPDVLALDATMPALSPNGQILLYHSERHDAEGIHALNLTTNENIRATQHRQYILPRWSGDNLQFTFVAQEPGSERWLYYQGFADGKSNPIILGDGRTPDWSPDGATLAFQGTDPEGNNPGIYLAPFGGGESIRLTDHESDRTPVFSPDGSKIAFMSTRNGNWDIFVVDTSGSGTARPITRAAGNDGLPAWSPDGSRLAFVSDRDGSWAIYTVGLAGGEPAKIAEWDGTNRPDWLTAQIWWGR